MRCSHEGVCRDNVIKCFQMKRLALIILSLMMIGVTSLVAQSERSVVVGIDSRNYYIHKVAPEQGVAEIAELYSVTDREIAEENGLRDGEEVEEGMVLRVPCYERVSRMQPKRGDARYDRYRVEGGESLFKIAVDFAISLDTLIQDNPGVDITNLRGRTTLFVRRSAQGKSQLEDIEAESRRYATLLNSLSREYDYFVVEEGDTLYSLAVDRGVDIDDFIALNGNPALIYKGMTLKVKNEKMVNPENFSRTELGDYLDSLAQPRSKELMEYVAAESNQPLRIAMMLPLSDTLGRVRGNFVEFWQGATLAAEELNREYAAEESPRKVELGLFDTKRLESRVEEIMTSEDMWEWNPSLFIGPIYETNVEPVMEYIADRGRVIPVVSPLESTTKGSYGRHYYRLAPTEESRVSKLGGVVGPETNVIMVYTASYDEKMEGEMLSLLGNHPYGKVIYNEHFEVDSLNSRPIEELMAEEDNLFVVLADNEIDTDRSLAIISSMMNSRQPKYGGRRVPIRVIGSAAWARYKNMDKNLLFKLRVSYLAPYHADRGNRRVRDFDRRYMEAFGRAPSMFAYRAYDAVRLFASAMYGGGDLVTELNGSVVPLLQTNYSFTEEGGNMVNDSWALVTYLPNYTIEVQ